MSAARTTGVACSKCQAPLAVVDRFCKQCSHGVEEPPPAFRLSLQDLDDVLAHDSHHDADLVLENEGVPLGHVSFEVDPPEGACEARVRGPLRALGTGEQGRVHLVLEATRKGLSRVRLRLVVVEAASGRPTAYAAWFGVNVVEKTHLHVEYHDHSRILSRNELGFRSSVSHSPTVNVSGDAVRPSGPPAIVLAVDEEETLRLRAEWDRQQVTDCAWCGEACVREADACGACGRAHAPYVRKREQTFGWDPASARRAAFYELIVREEASGRQRLVFVHPPREISIGRHGKHDIVLRVLPRAPDPTRDASTHMHNDLARLRVEEERCVLRFAHDERAGGRVIVAGEDFVASDGQEWEPCPELALRLLLVREGDARDESAPLLAVRVKRLRNMPDAFEWMVLRRHVAFGSDPSCALVVDGPGIGGRHAHLVWRHDALWVEALGDRTVRVGDDALAPGAIGFLHDGARVRLGSARKQPVEVAVRYVEGGGAGRG